MSLTGLNPVFAEDADCTHSSITISKFKVVHHKTTGDVEVSSGHADTGHAVDFVMEWNDSDHSSSDHSVTVEYDYGDGTNGSSSSHSYSVANAGTRNVSVTVTCDCDGDVQSDNKGGVTVHVIGGIEITEMGGQAVGANNRMSFNNKNTAKGRVLPVGTPGSDLIDWDTIINAKLIKHLNASSATLTLPDANFPEFNSLWGGGKTLYATIDGKVTSFGADNYDEDGELLQGAAAYISKTESYSAFFEAEGRQNDGADNPMNFFYYWSQTSANSGSLRWHEAWPEVTWDAPNYTAYLGPVSNDSYPTPTVGSNANTTLKYIDTFAWQGRHEWQHHLNHVAWWGAGGWDATVDTDSDQIPDNLEAGFGGGDGGPYDKTKNDTHADGNLVLDGERYTVFNQAVWAVGSADDEDWAHPGNQWP